MMPRTIVFGALALMLDLGISPGSALAQAGTSGTNSPSIVDRFGRLDTDKDGFIAWTEAAPLRRREFAEMDGNDDARVSPGEFGDRAMPFATVDADRDGELSENEYLAHHQSMFQRFDADADQRLNLTEFTAAQEAVGRKQ